MNPLMIKSFLAASTAAAYTIAAFNGTNNNVQIADGATAKILGVFDAQGAVAEVMADVIQVGIGEVKLGGTVEAGDHITSDASGLGIAVPANSTARVVGTAQAPGVAGDVIPVLVNPSTVTVPA